jgi:hypothetical protein
MRAYPLRGAGVSMPPAPVNKAVREYMDAEEQLGGAHATTVYVSATAKPSAVAQNRLAAVSPPWADF